MRTLPEPVYLGRAGKGMARQIVMLLVVGAYNGSSDGVWHIYPYCYFIPLLTDLAKSLEFASLVLCADLLKVSRLLPYHICRHWALL